MDECIVFGENIRMARKAMNLSLNTLAETLGITPGYLSQIEIGKKVPSICTFIKICNFFGEDYSSMLTCKASSRLSNPVMSIDQARLKRKQKTALNLIKTLNKDGQDFIFNFLISFKNFSTLIRNDDSSDDNNIDSEHLQ